MKAYSLRLWPNGEFGLGRYPIGKRPKFSPTKYTQSPSNISWTKTEILGYMGACVAHGYQPEGISDGLCDRHKKTLIEGLPLGLSNATKTHKRSKRGSKGITSYGKKMLRNGCWLLEKAAGVRRIGMFTGTMPPCSQEEEIEIVNNWGEIMRIFTQWLHRRLRVESPQPWVLGCVEVQEKRQARYGGFPLHCHLVFRSRVGKQHIVAKEEFCEAWKRAIVCCVPSVKDLDFSASTRVEQCKKSVASYLSKYMSKGITDNVARNLNPAYELPSTWWYGVGKFKQHIKRLMVYDTGEIASSLWACADPLSKHFIYAGNVLHEHKGISFVVGVYGRVSGSLRAAIQSRDSRRVSAILEAV